MITLHGIKELIKCFFKGHDWTKDRAGFDPTAGCYFRSWNCKRCHKLEVKRFKLPGDSILLTEYEE